MNAIRSNTDFEAPPDLGAGGFLQGSALTCTHRAGWIGVFLVLWALWFLLASPFRCAAAERTPDDPIAYDPGIPAAAPSEPSTSPPVPALAPPAVATNVSSASTNPPPQPSVDAKPSVMETLDDKHRLAVGDRVSFRIVEDEEEPRPLIVTDSGEIEVPYIGRFMAIDKTCKQLAVALKAELEKEYYYQATVMIGLDLMARSRGKVYLVGPVRGPGPQEIPSDEVLTLSKAILRAGGFLETADKKNVRVTRKKVPGPGEEMMTVNVADILEKGKTEGDMVLQVGDLIYIPERLIRF